MVGVATENRKQAATVSATRAASSCGPASRLVNCLTAMVVAGCWRVCQLKNWTDTIRVTGRWTDGVQVKDYSCWHVHTNRRTIYHMRCGTVGLTD